MKNNSLLSLLKDFFKSHFIFIFLFILIAIIFMNGIFSIRTDSKEEEKRIIEENVRRAIVTCYACEGSYPKDINYLKKNYGLILGDDYYIQYDMFASNIMPEITVIEVTE